MEVTDIIELAKLPASERIIAMREDSTLLSTLYFGDGTDELLAIINGYENTTQHDLRKTLAISMEFVIEELLRQTDSIWTAKGGNIHTEFEGEAKKKFKEALKDVRGGMNLRQFVKEIWWERFVTDPNGLIFMEVSEDGKDFEFTYKSINFIQAYKVDGIQPTWILFEPHKVEVIIDPKDKKKTKEVKLQWFVDSQKYVLLQIIEDEVTVVEEKPHTFEEVPAVVNSSIFNTKKAIKISPIHKQQGLILSYLVKLSVKEIHQFLHSYPIYWQYQQICPTCKGKRKVGNDVCAPCNGTGLTTRKDVSDVLSLKRPEQGDVAIGAPAGYESPDNATMGELRTELKWVNDLLTQSYWGTTFQKSDTPTATGRFIDLQPVSNKLNIDADIAQTVETHLMNLVGKWLFPTSFKKSWSLYGRRFIIETPDMLMERYLTSKGKTAPVNMLNWLLEQFYIAEFANDEQMADFFLTLMLVEPYVHLSIDVVVKLPITDEEKKDKIYYQEWLKTIEASHIVENKDSPEKLKLELREYSSGKSIEIKTEENGTEK